MIKSNAPKPPSAPDIMLITSGLATQRNLQIENNQKDFKRDEIYDYISSFTKETSILWGDKALNYLIKKDLGILSVIDDINTARDDIHQYKFPINYGIVAADVAVPTVGGIASGTLASYYRRNPIPATITGKVLISTAFNKIKEEKLND